ncbi:uncharacterized protein PHACADRAFT_246892 [Phanerochaete carnosa HHB-10118-sp]|uniref:Protein kinase domain-containing protein n=1 Tax=Phanerochaete carnosa (strain HHB-10118-sp) TaxID=650164 RepID=K5XCP8_PHACS|nr:uncharacterized protein PHACADRAFT_246892 [Phanerochaete carnosa HHB-10118-sp]EKM60772.1 hypothetical protein PHACADRAFT_246892 [Phanerochaete carnosa HHB-10118-sp]
MPSASVNAPATAATDPISRNFIGAVKDEWQLYSDHAQDYDIGPPIGYGASSIVYTATFQPTPEPMRTPCALKVVDLDRLPQHTLHLLMQETQLMSLSKHPNVLRVRGQWMDGHKLYIALRLMNAGSAADVMRYAWPGGMEEDVVKCILKQALEGINYLHINGLIHRDIKAANLLIDEDGTVLLGDLGVAAPLWETEDSVNAKSYGKNPIDISSPSGFRTPNTHSSHIYTHGHNHTHSHPKPRLAGKRKSFVGTPCWMAPEVITGKQYDASADIWSFGITALELTQGRAPLSRAAPASVLTHVATSPPPKMDRKTGVHTYSAAFADIVTQCLQKDPSKRPTAQDLLNTGFFKSAKKKGYLVGTVLKGLPPLVQRQEKRPVPGMTAHRTMDSWDFSVREDMIACPTNSVYSFHSHFFKKRRSTLPRDGITELNDEDRGDQVSSETEPRLSSNAATYAQDVRQHYRSRSHSYSWSVSSDGSRSCGTQPHSKTACGTPAKEPDGVEGASTPATMSAAPSKREDVGLPSNASSQMPLSPALSESSSHTSSSVPTSPEPSEPVTPPQPAATPQPKLWRQLVGRSEGGHHGKDECDDVVGSSGAGAGESFRRRAFGGMSSLVRTMRSGRQ